jgi:hypothetical protein
MSQNGTTRGARGRAPADATAALIGLPTEDDDAEPGLAPEETGTSSTAVAVAPLTRIKAKGVNGEDLDLEMGEDGEWRAISTSIPPAPVSAPVDHPLLGQLRARTRKPKGRVMRAPAYNHRMLWYMRPDGEVVKLQGDPGNRAYYEDKGFVVLTDEETRLWERDKTVSRFDPETGERETKVVAPSIRKQVIKLQRERAQLITTITTISRRHAAVEVSGDLSITPTDELKAMLDKLQRLDGPNFTLLQGRLPDTEREYADDGDSLDGLEVGRGDELERKIGRYREQMTAGGRQQFGPGGPRPVAADLSGNS